MAIRKRDRTYRIPKDPYPSMADKRRKFLEEKKDYVQKLPKFDQNGIQYLDDFVTEILQKLARGLVLDTRPVWFELKKKIVDDYKRNSSD